MNIQRYIAMMDKDNIDAFTPAYFFDISIFTKRIEKVKQVLGKEIPITFSIKANPFLLSFIPNEIAHVEVCSPGELEICKHMKVDAKRIIYSGVMKEKRDVLEAVDYGVDILTAESLRHVEIENEAGSKYGKQKVILRLTSGNQFGMSKEDIINILNNKEQYPFLEFYGIHFYSGTQKKKRKNIEKDLTLLEDLLEELKQKFNYEPKLVEYGPGLAVDYYEAPYDAKDELLLTEVSELLVDFANRYPLGIEMGRFLAAPCGTYITQVKDIKENEDINYAICDGGIHHIKYYGQTMAMQVPPIGVYKQTKSSDFDKNETYCLCGSLCTVADVLVREVQLPKLDIGDLLGFERCGAYSVTEGSALFLSRAFPRVYIVLENEKIILVRDFIRSGEFCIWN